jgi:general secretion pathway protein A
MYQAHWGLEETPFRGDLDPRYFYQSPAHEEALARLHFLTDHRRRLGLLLGGAGSGKSLLLSIFAEEVARDGAAVARGSVLGLEPVEFLGLLAGQWEMNPRRDTPVHSLWRLIADRVTEYRYLQRKAVVLLDDVDQAAPGVLTQIARLAQLDLVPQSQLTIVLAVSAGGIVRLDQGLLERAELRIDLGSWEQNDTEEFLNESLARAGRANPAFEPPAVERLHELGGGVPRRISQLADLALLAGAGRNLAIVDADTVESAYRELGVIEV